MRPACRVVAARPTPLRSPTRAHGLDEAISEPVQDVRIHLVSPGQVPSCALESSFPDPIITTEAPEFLPMGGASGELDLILGVTTLRLYWVFVSFLGYESCETCWPYSWSA